LLLIQDIQQLLFILVLVFVAESLRQADEYAADSSSLPSEESYIILSAALDCTVRIWSFETGACCIATFSVIRFKKPAEYQTVCITDVSMWFSK
jgi:WD40 repeat protein